MVKNCIQLLAQIGFETAKRLLTESYGDTYRIIAVYRKEMKHWSQIKAGNADENIRNSKIFWENLKILAFSELECGGYT